MTIDVRDANGCDFATTAVVITCGPTAIAITPTNATCGNPMDLSPLVLLPVVLLLILIPSTDLRLLQHLSTITWQQEL